MRVLIVDDSATARSRLAGLIEEVPGITAVFEAEDASSGVAALSERHPDVVVLEVLMPGGGLGVLRAAKMFRQPPVVMVCTSHGDAEHRAAYLAEGADHFLDKPHDLERLLALLRDPSRKEGQATGGTSRWWSRCVERLR